MNPPTLRRRVNVLLGGWLALFIALEGLVLFLAFDRFKADVLEQRLLLARTVAQSIDSTLEANFQGLARLEADLGDLSGELRGRLRSFRLHSVFREAVYLLDDSGKVIAADPEGVQPVPHHLLAPYERVSSHLLKEGQEGRPVVFISQPFLRGGRRFYLVAEMTPLGSGLSVMLQDLAAEPGTHLAVIDALATVIAAPDAGKIMQRLETSSQLVGRLASKRPYVAAESRNEGSDLGGHDEKLFTVMVPLRLAPWGVVVQQHRRVALANLYGLQLGLGLATALLVAFGLLLSRALSRSVVVPIQKLSERAERMRQGDLESQVVAEGDLEIRLLADTLDNARQQLRTTLDDLRDLADGLETQVAERTEAVRVQLEDMRLLHAVAQIPTGERDPRRLFGEILRLVAEHFDFEAVALTVGPAEDPSAVYSWPEETYLPCTEGLEPGPGWTCRTLDYREEALGRLCHPAVQGADEERVLEALAQQLAVSLHDSLLVERIIKQDAQRKVLVRRMLAATEEERRRIARELHDEISQLLTVIDLSLEGVEDCPEVEKARALLRRTQEEVHRVIHDLRPSLLDDLGLAAAVQWYADNYLSRRGIRVSLEVAEQLELSPEVETVTFRICQEIVTNILRHARAESVSLELYSTQDRLILEVEDDGVGFDPESRAEGAGIVGMRERASLVEGVLAVDSEPGMGTHVRLEVPLK